MADIAHRLTDEKLEEMEKRLSAIYSRAEKEIGERWKEYLAEAQSEIDELQMSASATSEYDALSNITLHSTILYDRCLTDNEVSAITNYNAERYGS